MQNQLKHIVVTCVFVVFLSFFVGMCVFCYFNPAAVSESERRPFAQFPEKITWEGVMDKTIINDFEDYYERKHFDAPYCPTTMTKYKYHTERCYETQNIKPVVCQKFFELRILSEVSVCNY